MISKEQIYSLLELKNIFYQKDNYDKNFDLTQQIESIGIDVSSMIRELNIICDDDNYFVGGHVYCTKNNVIPRFLKTRELKLDIDHLEGLGRIFLVSRGLIKDY